MIPGVLTMLIYGHKSHERQHADGESPGGAARKNSSVGVFEFSSNACIKPGL